MATVSCGALLTPCSYTVPLRGEGCGCPEVGSTPGAGILTSPENFALHVAWKQQRWNLAGPRTLGTIVITTLASVDR